MSIKVGQFVMIPEGTRGYLRLPDPAESHIILIAEIMKNSGSMCSGFVTQIEILTFESNKLSWDNTFVLCIVKERAFWFQELDLYAAVWNEKTGWTKTDSVVIDEDDLYLKSQL